MRMALPVLTGWNSEVSSVPHTEFRPLLLVRSPCIKFFASSMSEKWFSSTQPMVTRTIAFSITPLARSKEAILRELSCQVTPDSVLLGVRAAELCGRTSYKRFVSSCIPIAKH
jgi:hypothetical protein